MTDLLNQILISIMAICPELSNVSTLALWMKQAEVMALIVYTTQQEIASSEAKITDIVANLRYGDASWYVTNAKKFQYDATTPQTLTVDPVTLDPVYETIDETKQIIKQAAFASQSDGNSTTLTLKYAVLDSSTNELRAASNAEKTEFSPYMDNFTIQGLPVLYVSSDPNVMNANCTIYYDKKNTLSTITATTEAAFTDYKNNFAFNGKIYIDNLQTFVKENSSGVISCILSEMTIDGVLSNGVTELLAGYFVYDATFLTNITYVAI